MQSRILTQEPHVGELRFNASIAYWIVQKMQNILAHCEEHYDMGIIKNVF